MERYYRKLIDWLCNYRKLIYAAVLILSIVLFFTGIITSNSTIILIAVLVLWIHNILYCFDSFHSRFMFFLFHIVFFVFLMARPLINLFNGIDWINFEIQRYKSVSKGIFTVLCCIFNSLLCLWAGGKIAESKLFYKKNKKSDRRKIFLGFTKTEWISALRFIAICIFFGSLICVIIKEFEKVNFILNNSYIDFYTKFKSHIPYVIYAGSTFIFYSLCLYLATFPKKKHAYFILTVYVLSSVPMLVVGERNTFVKNVLFALVYFIFRDFMGDKEKWIGRYEKIIIAIGLPVSIFLLSIINYIREGTYEGVSSIFGTIVDFFFKQGVTFSWISSGFGHISELRNQGVFSYTLGSMVDYFAHGALAQRFFGAVDLGSGNSVIRATVGSEMCHHLSYTILPKAYYLDGHGTGSSYIIEIYCDFGMLGIIVFSLLLGAFLVLMFKIARKNLVWALFILCTIRGILYMPRSEAIGEFEFLWRMPFYFMIAASICGGYLLLHIKKKIKV